MTGPPSVTGPFAHSEASGDAVVCVRDHLGLAPLYAARDGARWVTASSVADLAARLPHLGSDLDVDSVVGHIAGPFAPIPPATFFSAVRQAVPGTVTTFAREVTVEPWWDPRTVPASPAGFDEAAAALRRLVVEVVDETVPPGPVAVTLSGGMDSSSVAAALVAAGRTPVAVTWVTPQFPDADEGRWARATAHRLGLPRIELTFTAADLLPTLPLRPDTPYVNPFRRLWEVTADRLRAEGIGTVVTGFSGDHLFGGRVSPAGDLAVSFRLAALRRYLHTMDRQHDEGGLGFRLRIGRREVLGPLAERVAPTRAARRRVPVPWLAAAHRDRWSRLQVPPPGLGRRPGRAKRIRRLLDGLVGQAAEDTALAAAEVELHHPLLDRRLVEFALGLPTWFLFDGRRDKAILRAAFAADLPDEVVSLRPVVPTEVAAAGMARRADLLTDLSTDLEAARLGFVAEAPLAERVRRFLAGSHRDLSFWNTLTLEAWLRSRR